MTNKGDELTRKGDVINSRFGVQANTDGTSHIISMEEAKYIYQDGAERLIIGTGQQGMV